MFYGRTVLKGCDPRYSREGIDKPVFARRLVFTDEGGTHGTFVRRLWSLCGGLAERALVGHRAGAVSEREIHG